jgi:hypothetical protein
MFVTRGAHDALIAAKDQTIARLQDEVCWLRRMVQPDRALSPKVSVEADLVLEGRQDQIQDEQQALVDSEAARILSGTY